MDTTFRLPVIRQLIQRDIYINRKSSLIFLGVLCGLIALAGLLSSRVNEAIRDWQLFHVQWYGTLFLLIGAIHTAGVFSEFRSGATLQDYLLLPASHGEKWVSRWLRSLPIYLLTFTVAYALASLFLQGVIYVVDQEFLPFFNPFDPTLFNYWKWYVLVHAIMLIGAVQFNRNPALKTVGIILITLFTYALLTGGIQVALFRNIMENGLFSSDGDVTFLFDLDELSHKFQMILPWILWLLILPLLWWISYLKLNEKEV